MCGIVGYVGQKKVIPILLEGLKNLEYRGYDSAGISYVKNNELITIKEIGKIANLEKKINYDDNSNIGIGHTRWATHGEPNVKNAHPHTVGNITLVHNGIIENYQELKIMIGKHKFVSETDTEVICAIINKLYEEEKDILKVLQKCQNVFVGSYALGILVKGDNEHIYTIRKDSPLIIGTSDHGNFIASDVPAILKHTKNYYLLENNEYACLSTNDVTIYKDRKTIDKELQTFEWDVETAMKNGFEHFMLKEIYEQPKVINETIKKYFENGIDSLKENMPDFTKYKKITIIGCGSAYHVGLLGKYLIEKYGNVEVSVEYASEYRYKKQFVNKNTLVIIISQSGETADSLASLRLAKENKIDTLAIVNVVGSSIAREADNVLYVKAGPEIAVATTKAYIAQGIMLSLIALNMGVTKNIIDKEECQIIKNSYGQVIKKLEEMLKNVTVYENIAKKIYKRNDIFFLGRLIDYALVMEGSLKLKEISYIHSEAYASGELKHGTISLITEDTPVISVITDDDIALKTISNIKEVKARGAYCIVISTLSIEENADCYNEFIKLDKIHPLINFILPIVSMQILAYYVAKLNNCDIDQPRNLAKSVTVE